MAKALLEHGADPVYTVKFIDRASGKVLEQRPASLSEMAKRAGMALGQKGMLLMANSIAVQLLAKVRHRRETDSELHLDVFKGIPLIIDLYV